MTLFGWDASHFDGQLSRTILAAARAEGIAFFTHKIGEALQDTEGTLDDTALAAARDAGVPFVGGYLIPRTTATPANQVSRWVGLADFGEPWWRDFPGWFWQIDLERWSYDNVPASVGVDCARRLRDATGRAVILYASHGQYGDELTGWDGPLWNADYVGAAAAGFAAMYPGDGWLPQHKGWVGGWAPYSGKPPAILQFTSSARIAGLSTCDANAFRGTVADFAAMIGVKVGPHSMEVHLMLLRFPSDGLCVITDGLGNWKGIPDPDALGVLLKATGLPLVDVSDDQARKLGVDRQAPPAPPAVPVALTDADRQAIADLVGAKVDAVGAKVDQLVARLTAAGDALDG